MKTNGFSKGDKVHTIDGLGTILSFKNGVYVIWAKVKLEDGKINLYATRTLVK